MEAAPEAPAQGSSPLQDVQTRLLPLAAACRALLRQQLLQWSFRDKRESPMILWSMVNHAEETYTGSLRSLVLEV